MALTRATIRRLTSTILAYLPAAVSILLSLILGFTSKWFMRLPARLLNALKRHWDAASAGDAPTDRGAATRRRCQRATKEAPGARQMTSGPSIFFPTLWCRLTRFTARTRRASCLATSLLRKQIRDETFPARQSLP